MLDSARNDQERIAIHRAMLTVAIGAMEQVDDSAAELAQLFRSHERAYLGLLRAHVETLQLLRDLLELVVWEDYGLFGEIEGFLRALPEVHADTAMRDLARIIGELRAADLDDQVAKARALRQVLLTPANALVDAPEVGGNE